MEATYTQKNNNAEGCWGWLSIYPQGKYGPATEDGRPEQMTVSVAQNATSAGELTAMNGDDVRGRTYDQKNCAHPKHQDKPELMVFLSSKTTDLYIALCGTDLCISFAAYFW